ncbi:ParB family protein [Chromatocurvus halotolerans]|nr:ParB family protein [Chromatocurvus halotolerans]
MSMDAVHESEIDSQSRGVASQLVVIPIDNITPYERNPRHSPNPARDRIKDSIRAHGLDYALAVTQPPGTTHYVLSAGGGTRLEVLRELFAETHDPRFGRVPCVLTPWPGEAEILLAYVRENDLRGELSFIDKARAVMACKELLEAEQGEPLSQQALSAALMRRGYGLSQAMISHMVYAVERLLPVIPVALEHGIGKPQVQRIRHLDGAAARLWAACGLETELPYDDAFLTLCRRYDGPDWSFDDLEEAVAVEIAEGADRSIQAVRLTAITLSNDVKPLFEHLRNASKAIDQ